MRQTCDSFYNSYLNMVVVDKQFQFNDWIDIAKKLSNFSHDTYNLQCDNIL